MNRWLVALVSLSASSSVCAQQVFDTVGVVYPAPSASFSAPEVKVGDLDGDGDLDYVGNGLSSIFVVGFNRGGAQGGILGTFGTPIQVILSGGTSSGLGDLDGDGDLDLVTAGTSGSTHYVFLNDGTGSFVPGTSLTSTPGSQLGIIVVDLDNDGDSDVASVCESDDTLAVFLNQGGVQGGTVGTFGGAAILACGDRPQGLTAGDIDNDGDLDIATNARNGDSIGIHLNQGGVQGGSLGAFAAAVSYPIGDAPYNDPILADFDADGDLDVANVRYQGAVAVAFNQGGIQAGTIGTFGAPTSYGTVSLYPYDLTSGDFDGDGDTDLAYTDYYGDCVKVLLNDGISSGTFSLTQAIPTTSVTYGLEAGDFDQDGLPDLVVSPALDARHIVLLNEGGTFTSPAVAPVAGSPGRLTVLDADGDGDSDVAVTHQSGNLVSLLENTGTHSGDLLASATVVVSGGPTDIWAGDVDLDGDIDVATADISLGTATVLHNQGGMQGGAPGDFVAASPLPVIAKLNGIVGEDLTGDMYPDLLVSTGYAASERVYRLLNNGDGSYAVSGYTQTNSDLSEIALGDLDGDGDPDAISAGMSTDGFVTLRNQGGIQGGTPGQFAGLATVTTPTSLDDVAVVDYDDDGDLDMVGVGTDSIYVRINRGGVQGGTEGEFLATVAFDAMLDPVALAVADFDGDDDLDVAVVDSLSGLLALHFNNRGFQGGATGDLVDPLLFAVGAGARDLAAVDLDADGDPELVVSCSLYDAISVLKNEVPQLASCQMTGDGEFELEFTEPLSFGHLSPSSYSLTGSGLGSYSQHPASVVQGATSNTVLLAWASAENFIGGDLTVTVGSQARDANGNPVGFVRSATAAGVGTGVPPASVASAPALQFGGPIVGTYNADDVGSGVGSVALYVRQPGRDWESAGPVSGGVFGFPPTEGPGTYYFATSAQDLAGNPEGPPLTGPTGEGDVGVTYYLENGPLTISAPLGSNVALTFPMEPLVAARTTFASITGPGDLTVSRLEGDMSPAGVSANLLVDQAFILTAGAGLVFDSATLEFDLDPSLMGGIAADQLTRAYRDADGSITEFPASFDEGSMIVTVPAATAFSTWYFGAPVPSNVENWRDWLLE